MSKEWIDMSDKVVIVTGGSMGIGSHIVEALLKNHAKVVIADMADCDAYDDNENVMYVKCNVTKKEEVEEIIDKYTKGRMLGIFGEEVVNVLEVNLALDGILE